MSGAWIANRSRPSTPALVARLAIALNAATKLGPAVGIAAIVDRVDAQENVGGAKHLGIGQGQRQEDRVSRRHIGDRECRGPFRRPAGPWAREWRRQGAAAELGQIHLQHDVPLDAQRLRPRAAPRPTQSGAAGRSRPTGHRAQNLAAGRWRRRSSNRARRKAGRRRVSSDWSVHGGQGRGHSLSQSLAIIYHAMHVPTVIMKIRKGAAAWKTLSRHPGDVR